jgi:hypothetical protein
MSKTDAPATPSRRSLALVPLALAPLALAVSGCVTVPPSQRAELAKPEMDPATASRQHEETFHNHVEAAREGAMGGHGGQGGGCGCG